MLIKNLWKKILLGTISLLVFIALTLAYLYYHNFNTVVPNSVYRSNQLSKDEFAYAIQKYQLKSIINLRLDYPADWYTDELDISKIKNVKHYNVGFWAYSLPDPQVLAQLVEVLDSVPRPVLIHCQGGADRSGLASAIILILSNEPSLSLIKRQVSYRYFALRSTSVGKQVLSRYEAWLKENNLMTSRENFLTWLELVKKRGWS
jgi:protein-tyrosine phosphatase